LIGEQGPAQPRLPPEGVQRIVPIGQVEPGAFNPRKAFRDDELDELAESIRQKGLVQPLIVREADGNNYEIVAGERRWRAAQRAGVHMVPVIIRELSDQEVLELAIIENVQRADLDPIEAASGYRRLMDEFELTQTEVARLVGKSRVALANTVRLLGLDPDVQALVSAGHLAEGHARALLPLERPEEQRSLARRAIGAGWTVRRVEQAVRTITRPGEAPAGKGSTEGSSRPALDPDTRAAVDALEAALGTRVEILRRGEGGRLVLHFYSEEELSALYRRLV
jgi:ParB family chromosome partitioning protein